MFWLILACTGADKAVCVGDCDSALDSSTPVVDTSPTIDTQDTGAPPDSQIDSVPGGQDTEPDHSHEPLPLCINEFMTDNNFSLMDDQGAYSDWIELYNWSEEPIDLDGWTLSDNPEKPDKHELEGGLVIEAGGELLLYADNLPELGSQHLEFSLAQEEGSIAVYAPDGRGSLIYYSYIESDLSAARVPDCCTDAQGCWQYVFKGTPGASNGT